MFPRLLEVFCLSQLVGAQYASQSPPSPPAPYDAAPTLSPSPWTNPYEWTASPPAPPTSAECLNASTMFSNQYSQCGYDTETCAFFLTTCTTYAASITEAKVQEMATAFASCTGSHYAYMFVDADVLTTTFLSAFSTCGITTYLTPPAVTTCQGAISKMGMTSDCGYEGAYTCSASACTANAASASDSMVADMITGLGKCTGDYASYGTYYTAETITSSFLSTFDACGLTTSLTPVPLTSCQGAISKMGMAYACGYEGAYTCSASACTANAASASDSMVADMITGLGKCTGDYASYGTYYTAETITSSFLSTFDACGLTTSLTAPALTTCAGAVSKIGELSSNCGSTSGDGLTCGASKCTRFAASVTDSMVEDVVNGLATCTGAYVGYSSFYTLELLTGTLLSTFDSCGFTTSLTRPALTSCAGATSKVTQLNSACGSSDDRPTCGASKCKRFAASVTDSALGEMATGLATCTGAYAGFGAYDPAVLLFPRLDECELTASASRPPLSTCAGAALVLNQGSHCGNASARTCSTTCSAFVSSVTAAAAVSNPNPSPSPIALSNPSPSTSPSPNPKPSPNPNPTQVQELTVGFAACEGIFQRFAPNAKPRPTPRVAYAYA